MKKLIIICIVSLFITSGIGNTFAIKSNLNDEYDLLIISPQKFTDELKPLIDHKNSYNVRTMIFTTEDIYNTYEGRDKAEQIKYAIKHALDNFKIKYVLLVGGRAPSLFGEEWLLPVRYSNIVDNWMIPEKQFVTDLYFADIYDENGTFSSWDSNNNGIYCEWYENKSADDICDLYPDVYVGRLPCRDKLEVKIMVDKIIKYESGKCPDSWFKKMVVIAGDTYTDNDYFEGEITTQQAMDYMVGYNYIKLWTSDGSFSGWKDVVREINKGCGFLFFSGHGSPGSWATHPPYDPTVWVNGLKLHHMFFLANNEKLPICVVGGCHNSMFNISIFHLSWTYGVPVPECWSWWLTRKIGGGAIATIGCSGLGYGKEDKKNPELDGGGDYINVLFFKEIGKNNVDILGKAWGDAISSYIDDYYPIQWNQWAFNDTALDAKTVQEWVLLGDPSLKIGGYD